jgi:hypothetical protein
MPRSSIYTRSGTARSLYPWTKNSGGQCSAVAGNPLFRQIQRAGNGPRLIVDLPESRDPISSFEAGYKLTEDLLRQKRPFTALVAFDDMTAFGAIRALSKGGLRVPGHCSVIGFDDIAASSTLHALADHGAPAHGSYGHDGGQYWCWTESSAVQEKREVSAVHRKVAPELAVRESTRSLF